MIAEPRLSDSNFFRSVVLLIEHAEQGASGLILNRPGRVQLSEIWGNVSDTELSRDETIFVGGPVQGPLAILHDQRDFAEHPLIDGVNLSMKKENLDAILSDESANLRVFSGYSGWGPGQLELEMKVGGWFTWPAQPEHVFAEWDEMYKLVCDSVGHEIIFGESRPKHQPSDPTLN